MTNPDFCTFADGRGIARLGYGAMRLTGQPGNFGPFADWQDGIDPLRLADEPGNCVRRLHLKCRTIAIEIEKIQIFENSRTPIWEYPKFNTIHSPFSSIIWSKGFFKRRLRVFEMRAVGWVCGALVEL